MSLRIERAGDGDVGAVLGLLNDAARWLRQKGVRQWDPGQWDRDRLQGAVARGETYLAHDGEVLVGTVNVSTEDARTWPEAGAAIYLHRLAVARAAHGRGIGAQLLAWAEREAQERGLALVRLDCACDNPALRAYYEQLGYAGRGERSVAGSCAARYEKQVR